MYTPVFGIYYPCGSLVATDFEQFALTTENAMAQLRDIKNAAKDAPSARIYGSGTAVTVSTTTTLTYAFTYYNKDSSAITVSLPNGFTVNKGGMYAISVVSSGGFGFTTMTSRALGIYVNGTTVARKKAGSTSTSAGMHLQTFTIKKLRAGDTVSTWFNWTGTGGPMTVAAQALTIMRLAR